MWCHLCKETMNLWQSDEKNRTERGQRLLARGWEKKTKTKRCTICQNHLREAEKCQELLLRSSLSTCFSLSSYPFITFSPICFLFVSICPKVTLSIALAYPTPSTSLSISILHLFTRVLDTQVSAVTALVQAIMVCNSLPAPLCRSGGPLIYKQREVICVCVCVCVCVSSRSCITLSACVCSLFFYFIWYLYMCLHFSCVSSKLYVHGQPFNQTFLVGGGAVHYAVQESSDMLCNPMSKLNALITQKQCGHTHKYALCYDAETQKQHPLRPPPTVALWCNTPLPWSMNNRGIPYV